VRLPFGGLPIAATARLAVTRDFVRDRADSVLGPRRADDILGP
jgi:hypothetical protein